MPRHSADNPAAIYRDSLSRGSYWAVHHSLETMVKLLDASDPWSYPWHRLRYRDTARVRAQLVERYAPATVNKWLSPLEQEHEGHWLGGTANDKGEAGPCPERHLGRRAACESRRGKQIRSGRGEGRNEAIPLLRVPPP